MIARKRLEEFSSEHPDARSWLERWSEVAKAAQWRSLKDVRKTFPHADYVLVRSGKSVTVFNASGNKYRLIVAIHYNTRTIYILRWMTHAEYDKSRWKHTV